MGCQFFICYAMDEDRVEAEAIRALLTKLPGVTCWMAPGSIPPGESYARAIPKGIRASDVVVVVFSKAADDSDDVSAEIQLARTYRKRVVPVRIADCRPDNLEYFLSLPNWVELHGPHRAAGEQALQQLANDVKGSATESSPPPPPAASAPQPAPVPAPVRRRRAKDPEAEYARLQTELEQQRGLIEKKRAESAQELWDLAVSYCQQKKPDFVRARQTFARAASAGKKDGRAEQRFYEAGAATGHIGATVSLALLLEAGDRVPKDLVRAKKLYESAAESGDADAMYRLGVLAMNGLPNGTPNYGAAQAWLRAAIAQGHADAMTEMGNWFQRKHDKQNAKLWLAKAAARRLELRDPADTKETGKTASKRR